MGAIEGHVGVEAVAGVLARISGGATVTEGTIVIVMVTVTTVGVDGGVVGKGMRDMMMGEGGDMEAPRGRGAL